MNPYSQQPDPNRSRPTGHPQGTPAGARTPGNRRPAPGAPSHYPNPNGYPQQRPAPTGSMPRPYPNNQGYPGGNTHSRPLPPPNQANGSHPGARPVPQGYYPPQNRRGTYAQGQAWESEAVSPKGKKHKKGSKKGGKVSRWILILLDLLIVVIIGLAIYFLVKPKIDEKNALDLQNTLRDKLRKERQVVNIEVPKGFGAVAGEDYENINGVRYVDNDQDNVGDTVSLTYVGLLTIPRIGVSIPVSNVADNNSLRFGVAIHQDFAGINDPGLTSIFGHRFLTKGRDFNRLDEVGVGDQFYLDYNEDGKRHTYEVDQRDIIPQAEILQRVEDASFLEKDKHVMLITCHPLQYGNSTERILVYGKEIKTEPIP